MKRLIILLSLLAVMQGVNAQMTIPYTYHLPDSYENGTKYCKGSYDFFSCENTHCWSCFTLLCPSGEWITREGFALYDDPVIGEICVPIDENGSLLLVDSQANNTEKNKLDNIHLDFSLTPYEFLGYCNQTEIENNNIGAWLECSGNFFSPVIPNPSHILDPISGNTFQDNLNIIQGKLISIEILSGISDLIIWIIGTLFLLLWNSVKYLIVFAVKFLFVYLFYISLGLQIVLKYADRNSQGLSGEYKIQATIGFMIIITIFALGYGGGWIKWS